MKIQLDLTKEINTQLLIYCAERELKDKRKAIIEILNKNFKIK